MRANGTSSDSSAALSFRAALRLLLPLPGDVSAACLEAASTVAATAVPTADEAAQPQLLRCGAEEDSVACLAAYATQADAALGKWERVLNNIIVHPADPKYRALKHTAPSFAALAGPGRPQAHPPVGRDAPAVVTMGKGASREEGVVRVAGILCDQLGFVGAAHDADVLELPCSWGNADAADDFSVATNRRRLEQQAVLLEDALVAILEMRAFMVQQRAVLAEALQATRLARERRQACDARLHDASLLRTSLGNANVPPETGAPGQIEARRFVALLRREPLAKVCSDFDKEAAVEHLRCMAKAVGAAPEPPTGGAALWAHSAVPQPAVHVLQWAVARLNSGDSGGGAEAQRDAWLSLRVQRALDVTPGATSVPATTAFVSVHATAEGGTQQCPLDHTHRHHRALAADIAEELSALANELWAAQHGKTHSTTKLRKPTASGVAAATNPHEHAARVAAAAAQRERDVVATNAIGDIAAVLEEEWHLDGAIGYRAPHRLEARRLHAAYSAKEVSLQELHDALEGHSARLKAKRDAAAREKKGTATSPPPHTV